jgi:hypothetical protein
MIMDRVQGKRGALWVEWGRPLGLLLMCLVMCQQLACSRKPKTDGEAQSKAPAALTDCAEREKMKAAVSKKGTEYVPRTRHKTEDGSPKFVNRLIFETSPYLLQHAHNPVDWFPWGEEAFALAKKLGRPVFLSVGYSTCHWCHVMEEESFEDEEIAARSSSSTPGSTCCTCPIRDPGRHTSI